MNHIEKSMQISTEAIVKLRISLIRHDECRYPPILQQKNFLHLIFHTKNACLAVFFIWKFSGFCVDSIWDLAGFVWMASGNFFMDFLRIVRWDFLWNILWNFFLEFSLDSLSFDSEFFWVFLMKIS